MNGTPLDEEEWIRRCTEQYEKRGIPSKFADEAAHATYQVWVEDGADATISPEQAADDDMDCWDEDEGDDSI